MTLEIPIVLVSGRSEFLNCVVALHSLLSNRARSTSYKVYLFTDFALGREQRYLDQLQKQFPQCKLMADFVESSRDGLVDSSQRGSSRKALIKYRLGELLPEVDRLLYVASDSLVQKDLTELYALDLQGNYLAAAQATVKYRDELHLKKYGEKVGVSFDDYIDTGVMLIDLAAMRRDDLAAKLGAFDQAHTGLLFDDQDAFNAVCRGRILTLSNRYNLTTQWLEIPSIRGHASPPDEALILRFTSKLKPWRTMRALWSERYLPYLLKSPARSLGLSLIRDQGEFLARSVTVEPLRRIQRKVIKKVSRIEGRILRTQREAFEDSLHAFSVQNALLSGALSASEKGISELARSPRIVVSLTTIAARLPEIATTIESLMRQTLKPDQIILWVDENRVSQDSLPALLRQQQGRGLSVRFCADIGPHTKLVPALKEYPDDIIITVDDDILYRTDLVECLVAEYRKDPTMIYCNEARFISVSRGREFSYSRDWQRIHSEFQGLNVLPLGVGGVLYPPRILDERVFDLELQRKLAPKADDIWFKAMSLNRRVICKRISALKKAAPIRPFSQEVALHKTNVVEGGNEKQVRTCFDYFDLWRTLGIEA